jgi:endonuclease YncB( thermonuclease family)
MLTLSLALGLAVAGQADGVPQPFDDRVVAVADGDTLSVLYETIRCRVRLAGIDAPEKGQAFGTRARQALGDKVAHARRRGSVQERSRIRANTLC